MSDLFIGCEAAQDIEPAAMIVGVGEELEVLLQFVVAAVMVALDGGALLVRF